MPFIVCDLANALEVLPYTAEGKNVFWGESLPLGNKVRSLDIVVSGHLAFAKVQWCEPAIKLAVELHTACIPQ